MPEGEARRLLRRLARRERLDFSDYLELRRLRDLGVRLPELDRLLADLEARLPVPFAEAIPHLVTLADAPASPPRQLRRDALRVVFAMREEFAAHGATRHGLMGFDLPDGEALKDWLDYLETERKHAIQARAALRALDGKIWAVLSGERRLPSVPARADER